MPLRGGFAVVRARRAGVAESLDSPSMDVSAVLAVVGSYLLGSIDFAVVVARSRGVDIHEVGSGNPGASNVLRTLGKGPAVMVLVGDALKGVMAAAIGWIAAGNEVLPNSSVAFAAGLAAVLGHCYPLYHRFRGGKGVATTAGVLAFVVPVAAAVLAAVWVVVVRLTKVASIGSLTVVVLTVPLAWWRGVRPPALWWLVAILVLVVFRHRANIQRMIRGSERKVPT